MDHNIYLHKGIVIHRAQQPQTALYVFDEVLGVIKLFYKGAGIRCLPGMLIAYNFTEVGRNKVVSMIDIIISPSSECYVSFQKLHRIFTIIYGCMHKNIPQRTNYSLLLLTVHSFEHERELFLDMERWIASFLLQDSGFTHQNFFLLINAFFMKLSGLVDSLNEHEVELFRMWLKTMNDRYAQTLEGWIDSCLYEQQLWYE